MAFKTRRQARYEMLRLKGFLPFEAQALSRVPFTVPYMPGLIAQRAKLSARAKRENWSAERYERHIKESYASGGWQRETVRGVRNDPFAMLRESEDRYKDRHPEYTSPWLRRHKRFRDFVSKFETTLEKYDRGRGR